ncbi:MAG: M14 family metallopeptidase [Bryobacterales bacterium]|nr:M14 family metallopeptidase [Bryobacterales bacterium]
MRLLTFLVSALPALAALPTPEEHFGHSMGEDRALVAWSEVVEYFRILDAGSDSMRIEELGRSTEGRPLILATIAAPETLEQIERYREILAKLADPRATTQEEAFDLAEEGKPAVVITCSIHSNEVASTMTAVQFVHDLLTQDSDRHRAILANTILLLVPSLNPDGVDKVREWYQRWVGGRYEGAPLTSLYHKYVGHDNNRDWYIFTQQETRLMVESVHNRWRPQIVYDVHQMGPHGARIFVPPWIDPIDPNIDALITQQVNAFGTAMAMDLTAAGKTGVLVNGIYDYYSPARHYQSYHGALRLLSESASARFASPITVAPEELTTDRQGYSPSASSWNFLEPWQGGEWRLRDIVDNQLITFESVLYSAALRRTDLLRNFYRIGQRIIDRGRGRAFVVPREQHDLAATTRLLRTLEFGDVEIVRALEDAPVGGRTVREGDFVVQLAQPYGAFANTLLSRQDYPDLRQYPGGPPLMPYDATAHTLPLLMGVEAYPVSGELDLVTEVVERVPQLSGGVAAADELMLSPNLGSSWVAVNRLLAGGVAVHRRQSDGAFLLRAGPDVVPVLEELADEWGVECVPSDTLAAGHPPLALPRVAIYAGHVPIMDEGWTRWLFDRYEMPYETVGNAQVADGIVGKYDVVILPDVAPEVLDKGHAHEHGDGESIVPPEYRGGLGDAGAAALVDFARAGGTVMAFSRAASYAVSRLGLPVENAVEGLPKQRFFVPGTLVTVEADLSHPLCIGMREREAAWFQSGPVFRVRRQFAAELRQVLRFPGRNVLASGWLLGEGHLANRAAVVDVPFGNGRVILFGIRPQYRGQSNATFKMVFNGLYL